MANAIMIQGTMSNVGKSVLTAGLCRIFHQDGYRCAPFKSQNMALNSFITEEGLEMGRAQVMQAEAAGITPSVRMNPILLKPSTDVGSQVIVNGEVRGNMSAREYFLYKKELIPEIKKAYRSLAEEYEIIVIEGAGSPAEINLKQNDIVNMGMAKIADAPVLLVGDIDRGGVFAQLAGTMLFLDEEEKALVKGMIINKFRGDPSLLEPGVRMLQERCRIPVLGVTPWLDVRLDDEDSLTDRFDRHTDAGALDLAVVRLPRISNFTDFAPLEAIPGVSLRYVRRVQELGNPDLILLPGTKSTISDLRWLRESGMEAAILKRMAAQTLLIGICGGYQMMGETLMDPHGVEGGGSLRGMGLLAMDTVFSKRKTRTRMKGIFTGLSGAFAPLNAVPLEGYEIHMGETIRKNGVKPVLELTDVFSGESKQDGTAGNNCLGTYVHGLFDNRETAEGVIRLLARRKGISPNALGGTDYSAFKEEQYDRLAASLRGHLDMDRIYGILEKRDRA